MSVWLAIAVTIIVLAVLLAFAAVGIACFLNPAWGMRHFGRSLMGGGELRKEWNSMGMSVFGLMFAGVALYLLYKVLFK